MLGVGVALPEAVAVSPAGGHDVLLAEAHGAGGGLVVDLVVVIHAHLPIVAPHHLHPGVAEHTAEGHEEEGVGIVDLGPAVGVLNEVVADLGGLVGEPTDLIEAPPLPAGHLMAAAVGDGLLHGGLLEHLAAPVVVLHEVGHLLAVPAVGVLAPLAEALADQHQPLALVMLQGRAGVGHGVVVQQELAVHAHTVGVGIQQDLMTAGVLGGVVADHTEELVGLLHALVLGGVEMHLTHMEGLVAAVDVAGGAVVEPHTGLLAVQVGHIPDLTRLAVGVGVPSCVPVLGEHTGGVPVEATILHGLTEGLENVGGDLGIVHLHGDDLKDAGLEDDLGVCGVDGVGQGLGLGKMGIVVLQHIPDTRRAANEFDPHAPDGAEIVFKSVGLKQGAGGHGAGEVALQHLTAHVAVKLEIQIHGMWSPWLR